MNDDPLRFGPFRLHARERLLTRDGQRIHLGDRAFSMLLLLAERAGEVVGKRELIEQVWPGQPIDEGTLRFHMSGLRKSLSEGEEGARYIATLTGRGYCFVAPVQRGTGPGNVREVDQATPGVPLPPPLSRMLGRTADVAAISESLASSGFVTITGTGGIGKTTVALAVAHAAVRESRCPAAFVDLGSLQDEALVPNLVSRAVGLPGHSADVGSALAAYLQPRRMLLLLDSCEHLIDAVALLAERISITAPGVRILATSREPLAVAGELIYRLMPLPVPESDAPGSAADLQTIAASALLIDRVRASGADYTPSPAEAALVAQIVRTLDGIPLAIELAASRVPAFGLAGTARLLAQRLHHVVHGRRTAVARHHTLGATLDWSYNLLAHAQQAQLARLAVFAGAFTMDAACAVAGFEPEESIDQSLDQFVAKSLVTADVTGSRPRYRLLDTTRAYLAEKLRDRGEDIVAATRHADFYAALLEEQNEAKRAGVEQAGRTDNGEELANVRAALRFRFEAAVAPDLAVRLAAAALPFLIELSLMGEARSWCERALALLDGKTGTRPELELQMVLAHSVMFTEAGSPKVRKALERALEIARQLDLGLEQVRILAALHLHLIRAADHRHAMARAEAAEKVARKIGHPGALSAAEACVGMSHHLMGNHAAAPERLNSVLARTATWPMTSRFGTDYRIPARMTLARHYWIVGQADRAAALAAETIDQAWQVAHAVTVCVALVLGIKIFIWRGDWKEARAYTDELVSRAENRSLAPYDIIGRGYEGELLIRTGDVDAGMEALAAASEALEASSYRLMRSSFHINIAEGLVAQDKAREALGLLDQVRLDVEASGDLLQVPELLRWRGICLDKLGRREEAESVLRESVTWARRQGAASWQLRGATALAALLAREARFEEAREVLTPVFESFREGLGGPDISSARQLLHDMEDRPDG